MDFKLLLLVLSVATPAYVNTAAVDDKCATGDHGLQFLGVCYNLIKGNPDGETRTAKGDISDPGIVATRKVVKVSFEDKSAIKEDRANCKKAESVYENTKAYQTKLMNEINTRVSASYLTYSFSASAGYRAANDETTNSRSLIYEQDTICFKGGLRYDDDKAGPFKYTITDSFAAKICDLPLVYNAGNKEKFMEFIDEWGTHVITELKLGTKKIVRKKTTYDDVYNYAAKHYSASISVSARLFKIGGSLEVNVAGYKKTASFLALFNSNVVTYSLGTDERPEPIKLTLKEITVFLESRFWTNLADLKKKGVCGQGFSLTAASDNIKRALPEYPKWLAVQPAKSEKVTIPLTWPKGTYGLPGPKARCSSSKKVECPSGTWYTGTRKQDTEDGIPRSTASPANNCITDVTGSYLDTYYCMKHNSRGLLNWPKGSYCIYKARSCPAGFTQGMIKWDDEDKNNKNAKSGYLPDGSYTKDTIIYYCCRNDEFPTQKIYLPTEKPFYLLSKTIHCQQVHGMNVARHQAVWFTELNNNKDRQQGSVPYYTTYKHFFLRYITISMCYYTKL